ncbi:hypothetical protein V8E55_012243 [Tylopilus felleus]
MGGLMNPLSLLADIPNLQGLSLQVVALPTQAFFVYRIYVLSGKNMMAPLLWVGIHVAKAFYSANGFVHSLLRYAICSYMEQSLTLSNLAVGGMVDALIAIFMTILLLRQRTATEFVGTLHILQWLTIFAVNTGLWTAMFTVLSAVLMHVFSTSALYMVFSIPLSSLYCNAFLANLNVRSYVRGEGTTHKFNAGAEMVVMDRTASNDTTTAKQSMRFSSAIHLDIRKTMELASFPDLSRKPGPEHMV